MVKYCVDPLKLHINKVSTSLRVISDDLFKKCEGKSPQETIICTNSCRRITTDPKPLQYELHNN